MGAYLEEALISRVPAPPPGTQKADLVLHACHPGLGRQWQEGQDFKVIFGYFLSLVLAGVHETLPKTKQNKTEQKKINKAGQWWRTSLNPALWR